MKIKIISDGTQAGTKVINEETGEPLKYVTEVVWRLSAESDGLAEVSLTMVDVPVELQGDAQVLLEEP